MKTPIIRSATLGGERDLKYEKSFGIGPEVKGNNRINHEAGKES